ncbi:MAG: hypothetical protein EAZ57_07695 [Cytophagales bacterium]|nr:MAG: hypothetical protein EAZ67_08780 [Cytophagales bacterium]TAF60420.1 MAG: hypothetical protein EAZ57_07695 [Cytophagales bacterium]
MSASDSRKLQIDAPITSQKPASSSKKASFFELEPWGLKPLQTRWNVLLIAFIALFLNINTLGHQFVFDDIGVLSQNKFVLKGISGIPEIVSNRTWEGFAGNLNTSNFNFDYAIYRPLSLVAFAVEMEIMGLNPSFFHLMHIIYFVLCCVVVFFLMQELTNQQLPWLSLLVALIYTVHPVHVEVVANLKSRDELFAALFGFLGLLYGVRYARDTKQIKNLVLGLFFYSLGLLSKESALTLSAVFPLALFYFTDTSWRKILTYTAIFAIPVVVVLGIRQLVLAEEAPLYQFSYLDNPLMMADTLSRKLGLRLWTIGKDLLLLALPYELRSSYHFSDITYIELADWRSLLSLFIHVLLGFCLVRFFMKKSFIIFGLAFYVITFSMYSNVLFVMNNLIAERWFFTPSLGFCILLGALFYRLMQTSNRLEQVGDFVLSNITWVIILCTIVLAFGYKTINRNLDWRTNATLFAADVKTCPKSVVVAKGFILTLLLEHKGKPEELKPYIPFFEETIRISPTQVQLNFVIGRYYYQIGEYKKAEERLSMLFATGVEVPPDIIYDTKLLLAFIHNAIETDPKNNEMGVQTLEAHIKRMGSNANFLVYKELGLSYYWLQQYPKAIENFQKAISAPDAKTTAPADLAMAWTKMAAAYALINDLQNASKAYGTATNLAPESFEALAGYARVLNMQGFTEQANAYAARAQAAQKNASR